MKLKQILGAALVALLFLAFAGATASAQTVKYFGLGGTKTATSAVNSNSWAVIPAPGQNSAAVVTYLNATSDTNNSVVQFYTAGAPINVNYTGSGTNYPVSTTNGFAAGDVVILQHMADNSYERRTIFSAGATNLVLSPTAPASTLAIGDLLYKATAAGSIPVGVATKELNAGGNGGIYAGQLGKPLLLDITGGTNQNINAVGGFYP